MFTTKYPPLQALSIGQLVLASENYGSVTKIAKRHKISRSTCYNYAQKASFVSENWSLLLKKQCTSVTLEKELFILQEYVLHHSSIRAIIKSLRLRGFGVGKGEVSGVIRKFGSALPAYDTLPQDVFVYLAIDETFEGDIPYLVIIDCRTGYMLGLMKADNRKSETWTRYLESILRDSDLKQLNICADFASQIGSCLRGLGIVFHGDLFHYYHAISKELVSLMNKFKKAFSNLEKSEKVLRQAQKALDEQLVSTTKHKEAVQTAIRGVKNAHNQANLAMQHYDNAHFLLQESKNAFAYFDEHSNWVSLLQAQQILQTVCQLFREIPDKQLQKSVDFFEKQIPAATQYIADIETEVVQLVTPETGCDQNIAFLWQVVACICKHQHNARCCKPYAHQVYHQQQAEQWKTMLIQQIGAERTQTMLQKLQLLLTKANRSSSMIETTNSRLKPFLQAGRGQISQERLNIIRHFLNHSPYERSRVDDRKGFSPYQLFYQKKDDKRNWQTIISQEFLNKSA